MPEEIRIDPNDPKLEVNKPCIVCGKDVKTECECPRDANGRLVF